MNDQRGSFRLFSILGGCLGEMMLVQMRPNTSYRVEIAIVSSASQRRFPEYVFWLSVHCLHQVIFYIA